MSNACPGSPSDRPPLPPPPTCELWGLPLAAISYQQALDRVAALVERGEPSYFITANMNYAMLAESEPDLAQVTQDADFLVADGVPFVWISAWKGRRLPERIAGADMVVDLCRMAADRDWKVFFLGGAPGVGEQAAANLQVRFPSLRIVDVASPRIGEAGGGWEQELGERIRAAAPDLLFAALGMPKGEFLLARLHRRWGVPVSVQVGMSLDLAAGRVRRAPPWVQRAGLEMFHRVALEPRRLFGRYARNLLFMTRMIVGDVVGWVAGRPFGRRSTVDVRRPGA